MTCRITFMPDGKAIDVLEGTKISEAAKDAGVKISLPCGGRGRCGKCIVIVGEGCGERVLACQTDITEDMVVTIPSESGKVIAASDHRKVKIDDLTPMSEGYGLAIDIGTTTVALDIIDLKNGVEIYNSADMNRQRDLGEDVLTRIQYAEDNGTEELRSLIVDSINDLIDTCLVKGFSPEKIKSVYVAANTTMTHLFLGVNPAPIRLPPFEPVFKKAEVSGKESGLTVSSDARVVCMPSVSSYVGGDITSGIVDSGMDKSDGLALFIDVGTNGEVALGNSEMMLTCSSSAGPAFEGSQMTSGMLARPGAIDSVVIDNGIVRFTSIGDVKPKGICGSGIIDLVAQLFINKMIDKRGNFTEAANAKDGVFTVTDGVVITQDEIRNVIMTKAAIYSSTRTMVRSLGITFDDLDKIYIAGGFGNFINMESAIAIGLFPDVDCSKFEYLGNSSLAGAKYALLSESFRKRIDAVFERMTYVDLSSDPVFFDEYMSAQFLPHTDKTLFSSILY